MIPHETRLGWLEWCESKWIETANPLYVWRALDISLHANPRIVPPEWCLAYLAEVASNINCLAQGRHFHGDRNQPVETKNALSKVTEALGLSSERRPSAFKDLIKHNDQALFILIDETNGSAITEIERKRNVSKPRAHRVFAEAKARRRKRMTSAGRQAPEAS